jgi:hypothetical protein
MEEIKFRKQQETITTWIKDPRHVADATCRHILELYAQLNDSEFLYVCDFQSTYDEARCFFLQWVLGKEIKELVNSARISAVQAGRKFTWIRALTEVLRSLTDITYTVRFLALARLKRQQGTAAKLWISQVLTRKALLEDPKLPASIYPKPSTWSSSWAKCLHRRLHFDCPSIGDDLSAKDGRGRAKYTLERIKRSIDDCSNPPHFRGVKTPVTDILDPAEPKLAKEKRDQTKDKGGKETAKAGGKEKQKRTRRRTLPTPTWRAAPTTNNPPNSLPALNGPTLTPLWTATKLPRRRNANSTMISKEATAPAATRAGTSAATARNLRVNDKRNLTKKNTGNQSSSGHHVLPPATTLLPLSTPNPRRSLSSALHPSRSIQTKTTHPPIPPSLTG